MNVCARSLTRDEHLAVPTHETLRYGAPMIRVSVFYPNEEGGRFDHEYYNQRHLPLVKEKMRGLGLLRAESDRGMAGEEPESPPPYVCIAHLYFNSAHDFERAMAATGEELMADLPNYTNLTPRDSAPARQRPPGRASQRPRLRRWAAHTYWPISPY
jgi:uncharacterized protein (TIGR02118 family)